MKLDDLKRLPDGTQLLTTDHTRVTVTGMTQQEHGGRTFTVATTRSTGGGPTSHHKPASLRPAPDAHPLITGQRQDLAGHTITVERADRVTARRRIGLVKDWRALIGQRAVVERHDGRLGKVCCIAGADGVYDDEIERAAEATAHTYGARYIDEPATAVTPMEQRV